jgi:hypothetical protein
MDEFKRFRTTGGSDFGKGVSMLLSENTRLTDCRKRFWAVEFETRD